MTGHDLISIFEIPNFSSTITRSKRRREKRKYADAETAIILATGLNSTKATLRWWPVNVNKGCVIVSVGPPSGNSHNYWENKNMSYHNR